jgi:hypothetical protein
MRSAFRDGHFLLHYRNIFGRWMTAEGGLDFTAEIDSHGAWTVQVQDFGDGGVAVVIDPDDPSSLTSVSLRSTAVGCIDVGTGFVKLELQFAFTRPLVAVRLPLQLSTTATRIDNGQGRTVEGVPLDLATNRLQLAGDGHFLGAPMNGRRCLAQFSGRFETLPWAAPQGSDAVSGCAGG